MDSLARETEGMRRHFHEPDRGISSAEEAPHDTTNPEQSAVWSPRSPELKPDGACGTLTPS